MPRDSNYFEESSILFQDQDLFVSRAAEALYQQMLAEHSRERLAPVGGFNILYFFQSVIHLLLLEHPHIELTSKTYPYPCKPIHATNWPDRLDKWNGNKPILEKFVELVKADSVPSGEEFDVSYALRIISLAIDSNGGLRSPIDKPEMSDADFECWLSGFNSGHL